MDRERASYGEVAAGGGLTDRSELRAGSELRAKSELRAYCEIRATDSSSAKYLTL